MNQFFVKLTPRVYDPDCRVQVRGKPLYGADVYWPVPCTAEQNAAFWRLIGYVLGLAN